MLSAESAAGKYPIESVAMMAKIVTETEMQIRGESQRYPYVVNRGLSIPETICEAMAHAAEELDVTAIAVFTETGNTARLLSKYHPVPPIFALSSVEKTIRPHVVVVGGKSGAVPENVAHGSDGRHCGATAVGVGQRARGTDSGHGGGDENQVRIDEFSAAAHGWG